jgi:hypothetical protein
MKRKEERTKLIEATEEAEESTEVLTELEETIEGVEATMRVNKLKKEMITPSSETSKLIKFPDFITDLMRKEDMTTTTTSNPDTSKKKLQLKKSRNMKMAWASQ